MIASEPVPVSAAVLVGRSPSSLPWRPSRKHSMIASVALFLISGSVLAGVSANAAIPAIPVANNDHHVVFFSDAPAPCPGEKPGMCPD